MSLKRQMMEFRKYDVLPPEAEKIRTAVFMEEQGFRDEFDDIDARAEHIVMYDGERPVATCRFYRDRGTGDCIVGRIAVIREYRGRNIGTEMLKAVEAVTARETPGVFLRLHAQVQAKAFYEKQGYSAYGEVDLDEDCPHVWMCKKTGESLN